MIQFQTNSVNNVQPSVNFKARAQEGTEETKTDAKQNLLDNPMETVGRSQVNFKGGIKRLASEDLNYLADNAKRLDFSTEEVLAMKDALVKTLNDFRCETIPELAAKMNKSLDKIIGGKSELDDSLAHKINNKFNAHILKAKPDFNLNKITPFFDDFIKVKRTIDVERLHDNGII